MASLEALVMSGIFQEPTDKRETGGGREGTPGAPEGERRPLASKPGSGDPEPVIVVSRGGWTAAGL